MLSIEEKIAEIANADLRRAIAEGVAKLKKRTPFGLVFEEREPEVVPIHGARIKRDARVARLPLFAAIFPNFCEPRGRKRLIDMAWSSAESAKHVVVPTFPLA